VKTNKVQDCYGNDFKVDLKPLGKGDVGIAYLINNVSPLKEEMYPDADDKKYVLKQVQFRTGEDGTYDADADAFLNETCIGIEMGNLGIAPRIYECWLCSDAKGNEYGYYTMDKIDKILTNEYPGNSRKLKPRQELRAAPREIQEKIVGLLEVMINTGYVHNDNHPGNIGIMEDGEPVLFDFGFAIKADHELTEFDKLQALGFALYQIIEQYDKDIAYDEDGVFYDLIYLIRQNKYKFGSHIQHLKHYSGSPASSGVSSLEM
jgi:hypothetical protein